MCLVKALKHIFPFITMSTIVPNNTRIHVNIKSSSDYQHCFSVSCLFVLISHHFKPLTEIRTNFEQIKAEAAKKK